MGDLTVGLSGTVGDLRRTWFAADGSRVLPRAE